MQLNKDSYFKFSGGEVHCKGHSGISTILMKDYTMDGFMALCEYLEVHRRIYYGYSTGIKVIYPYFPYARQDRVMVAAEPFSLKVFCKLLNSLELDQVLMYDPHSDVTPALVNNAIVISQHSIAKSIIPIELLQDHTVMIVSPDAGAYKKVSKLVSDDMRIVLGHKVRNSKGEIIRTGIHSPVDITGRTCIIVDDICDGGRTFVELAKALKDKGAGEIHLYVTHGIFSKGVIPLWEAGITRIYTTDSFPQVDSTEGYIKRFVISETFHNFN